MVLVAHHAVGGAGNAAWPMGVTMVGIHERAAREKISQSQTARALPWLALRRALAVLTLGAQTSSTMRRHGATSRPSSA
jgi:hypothetical protein